MRSLSRKGELIEFLMIPMFTLLLGAIIIVLTLNTVNNLGESKEFEKTFFSMDLALTMDSIHAVRADVNFFTDYEITSGLGVDIFSKSVTVYEEDTEDGKTFWFNEDPNYVYVYGSFRPKRKDSDIRFFRQAHTTGVVSTDKEINLVKPYCEIKKVNKVSGVLEYSAVQDLGNKAVKIISDGAEIYADVKKGDPTIKVFINKHPDSEYLACRIIEEFYKEMPELEGYAIVPINTLLLSKDDERRRLAEVSNIAAYVELQTKTGADPRLQATIYDSVKRGVRNVVELA